MLLLPFIIIGCFSVFASCQEVCIVRRIPDKVPDLNAAERRQQLLLERLMKNSWTRRSKRDISDIKDTLDIKEQSLNRIIPVQAEHDFSRVKRQPIFRRKEYRQMTTAEMNRFHKCLRNIKNTGNIYDHFTRQHRENQAPGAHFGAAFLPWHREYLYRVEAAMRNSASDCTNVYIPYWDCALDEPLPSPHHSVLWTNRYWGKNTGFVNNGRLCKNWGIIPECSNIGNRVRRAVSKQGMDFCSRENILNFLAASSFGELVQIPAGGSISRIEAAHGSVHCYVGECLWNFPGCTGHLGCTDCSPSDPVFYMLHSFFDCLWYEWDELPGTSNVYPVPAPGDSDHQANDYMDPFQPLRNKDGMYNIKYSRCYSRPSRENFRCSSDAHCDTPQGLLWCSGCGECRSKVKPGGNCEKLPNKACYCRNPNRQPCCINNKCRCRNSCN